MKDLTTEQTGIHLGVDESTVRRMCEKGYLPGAYKDEQGHWRIPFFAIDKALRIQNSGRAIHKPSGEVFVSYGLLAQQAARSTDTMYRWGDTFLKDEKVLITSGEIPRVGFLKKQTFEKIDYIRNYNDSLDCCNGKNPTDNCKLCLNNRCKWRVQIQTI